MDVVGVREDGAFGQKTVEAGMVFGAEAGQVVVSELVDDDCKDELRFFGGGGKQTRCSKRF